MGWFSDLRDDVLKPAAGFVIAGPAGAAAVSGAEQARQEAKKGGGTSKVSGLPASASDLHQVSTVNAQELSGAGAGSTSGGLFADLSTNAIAIGLLFGFVTLMVTSMGRK